MRWLRITPIFKEGKKKYSWSNRPVCLTLVPGKVVEQILLDAMPKPRKDKKVIVSSQHGFTRAN